MRSKLQLGMVMLGASTIALVTGFSVPVLAQSGGTPITDEFGFTGTSPNGSAWLEAINEQYGLPTETPVTDQFASEVATWAEEIRGTYEVTEYPTPVTDESGAAGTSPDSSAWYERMKEDYGIGTGV